MWSKMRSEKQVMSPVQKLAIITYLIGTFSQVEVSLNCLRLLIHFTFLSKDSFTYTCFWMDVFCLVVFDLITFVEEFHIAFIFPFCLTKLTCSFPVRRPLPGCCRRPGSTRSSRIRSSCSCLQRSSARIQPTLLPRYRKQIQNKLTSSNWILT